jgi:very-short-patch-repair endonuclease
MIENRRAAGRWLTLDRGVYALNSAPFTWFRQAKAAELGVVGSAISHRAAAHLHGVDGYPAGRLMLTTSGPRHTSRLARIHRWADPTTVVRNHITVVAVPLMLVQLAGTEPPGRMGRTIDDVLVSGLASHEDLLVEAERRAAGHPRGIAGLLDVLAQRGEGYIPPTSALEAALYDVLADPSLPPFQRQAPFPWWPEADDRVDALIPSWRRIIEADGRRWHTRRADFERDRWRDHQAQRHGYEVTRFTWLQLDGDPDYVLEVLLAIGRGHPRLRPAV